MKLDFEEKNEALVLHLPEVVDVVDYNAAEADLRTLLNKPCKVAVVDFSKVNDIKPSAHRLLNLVESGFRGAKKKVFWLSTPSPILAHLREGGHVAMAPTVTTLESALKHVRTKTGTQLDVDFVGPFIAATKKVLEVQAQTRLMQGKAFLRQASEELPVDIAGLLEINSPNFRGTIALLFRGDTIRAICEAMFGEKYPEINDEVKQAAGELLNIIYGQARKVLNEERGYQLEMAIPSVLVKDQATRFRSGRGSAILLPFEGAVGKFHLEIMTH